MEISSLPDDIVCNILSFLTTKEAALTSILSKRWRNLFALTQNLRFEDKDFVYQSSDPVRNKITRRSFIDFVNRMLAVSKKKKKRRILAVSGTYPIRSFSLECAIYVVSADINRWICNVLSRGVLEHLQVSVYARYTLPLEIFTCKTLVTLKLRRVDIPVVPENASLPALKTLHLDDIRFSNHQVCVFEALLSACPVIDELLMLYVNVETVDQRNCTLSCPTLQRLTLKYSSWPNSYNLTFETPSLVYLDYSHSFEAVYPDFNLDSLVEAKLRLDWSAPISKNPIKGLKDVQILQLSSFNTMKVLYTSLEAIPVFKNLIHLSIPTMLNQCCLGMPLLLTSAPNLETLVIKDLVQNNDCRKEPRSLFGCLSRHSCLLSCRVKVLEITMDSIILLQKSSCEVQLKHFLQKLPCLELVKVYFWEPDYFWDADEEVTRQWSADLLNHFK